MRGCARYILFVSLLAGVLCGQAAGQIRVVAQVDTSKDIYVGQAFQYMVIIDGHRGAGEVDVTPLAQYNPRGPQGQDISQTSIRIVNGRRSETVTKRYVMSYVLTANRVGVSQLPALSVTIDGKAYKTNPVRVNILEPGKTDKLDLEVELSEKQCYVGQPIVITVRFYVEANTEVGDFQFNIPAFSGDDFHVEDADVTDPQAKQFQLNTGLPVLVSQQVITYKQRQTVLVSFNKVLIPKRAGLISLGKSSVSVALAVGRARSRDEFGFPSMFAPRKEYKRFMVTASELSLDVLPLPEEGKPDGFYGLLGKYTISAAATPVTVNVGDPITLTIRIAGDKFLKPVQWPQLEQIPAMAANFKIPTERSTPIIEGGGKVFTQTIRATNDEVTEIPAIPLALFDPDKGRYVVAKSEPIKLEVAPTKVLTTADIESVTHKAINKEVVAITKGLSANYDELDVLRNQAFSPLAALTSAGYMMTWLVPLLALLGSIGAKLATHTSPAKQAERRRRQACGKAVRELNKIEVAPAGKRAELVASALKQYVGERFDKVAGSLTADDCFEAIEGATGDGELAGRCRQIITNCETARYAAGGQAGAIRADDVADLVRQVDKAAGRKR